MNVKLLRKVKRHILAEPKRLAMSIVVDRKEDSADGMLWIDANSRPFAKCGTAACIAGWACILSGKPEGTMSYAEHLLDINSDQSDRLFLADQWPKKFEDGATDDGTAKTAKVAAARIEHFIKTKGRE